MKEISYTGYIKFLLKKWCWVAIEYLIYGFFVVSGGIVAVKLFWWGDWMKEINVVEFRNAILENKNVIVKFGAAWCTECSILKVKIAGIESDFPDIDFYELDVSENMAVADEYQINELPILVAFKKGKEISRWCGSVGDLAGWLKMLTW